jgi:hypothetical protein
MVDTCHFGGGSYIAKFNVNGTSLFAKTKVAIETNLNFKIQTIKSFENNIFATAYVFSNNKPLLIDTISIPILCESCSGIVILCMDTVAKAKWVKVDGLPHSAIVSGLMDMNKSGDIYCFASTAGLCTFSDDTIISQGTNRIVVRYNKSGIMLGYNHLNFPESYSGPFNTGGITVKNDNSYFITNSFQGSVKFGNDTVTSLSNCDLFLAHFSDNGECLGFDNLGNGQGCSIATDETGIYITGVFPPFPSDAGSIAIGEDNFSTYGYEDIIFAKHDLMTGTRELKQANDNTLVIYANPNKGSFRVKIPAGFANAKDLVLSIYDMKGKLIGKQAISLHEENPAINIYGQPAGSYAITLSDGGRSYRGKMVVE